jgi:CheY-like chemotaxis protein
LGGEIKLESTPGQGSTFTLYLPQHHVPLRLKSPKETVVPSEVSALRKEGVFSIADEALFAPLPSDIQDDRSNLKPGDQIFLIVEDDITFASLLLDLAREHGFKGLIAFTGEAGLAMVRKFRPQAMSLDLRLPDMEGWALLDYLKHDIELRHIPVQVLSGGDAPERAFRLGAFAYLRKPVEREDLVRSMLKIQTFLDGGKKNLLIVEDSEIERNNLIELLSGDDVETKAAGTAAEALEILKSGRLDCLVLDLGLPDVGGIELIERIKSEVGLLQLPIIVHTGRDLSPEEEARLSTVTSAIVVKDATSPERIVEAVSLFLHRPSTGLGVPQRKMLQTVVEQDTALAGKTVLLVDDDMRNIYALSSKLEQLQMNVVFAQNGRMAMEELASSPAIDVVLMDIMMPEMDGYQAMREIRKIERFRAMPIIALTAKAMKGDRERCIEAGASDYIPKPVDTERLLSQLRVWLCPKE